MADALQKAGGAALALALEDDAYRETGKALQKAGLDLEGAGMSDKMIQAIDNVMSKYGPI